MEHSMIEEHVIKNKLLPFIFAYDAESGGLPIIYYNWHKNVEILFCTSGSGIVKCNSVDYELSEGDICVIGSMVVHGSQNITSDFAYYCLIVDYDFCTQNAIAEHALLHTGVMRDEVFSRLFHELDIGYETKGNLYELQIRGYVLQILYHIYKHTASLSILGKTNAQLEGVRQALLYIERHYREKITLDDIARQVGISRYHLTRVFREITGKTIFEHINAVRCKYAGTLITSGHSVSEAAWMCGFRNMSYFSRTYKRLFGVLPSRGRE